MPREDRDSYIIRRMQEDRANKEDTITKHAGGAYLKEELKEDLIEHPPHYNKGIETSTYIKSWNMNWNQANVVKYISRYNLKNKDEKSQLDDLKKARWYLEDLIKDYERNIKLL